MKKLIGSLVMVGVLLFSFNVSTLASVDSTSVTTNKVDEKIDVYVKNSSNKKATSVTLELKKNGKTVNTKTVKVKPDKRTKVKFTTSGKGKYEVKYKVDKKSSKTPPVYE